MIALDTNVLVRYLVEDDAAQTAKAVAAIDRAAAAGDALFVSDIVLCEIVWVLRGAYKVARATIVTTLRDLLRARHLAFAAPDELARALDAFAHGKGDFSDYLLREHARGAGCERVLTFDRTLLADRAFASP